MCMTLYIGSDNELPVIKWERNTASLVCVEEIPGWRTAVAVKKHLTKEYQYIVIGGSGCACDFCFDAAEEIDDISERDEAGRQIISDLFDYIKNHVSADHCELYSCWTADEELDAEHKDIIKINEFDWKNKFYFLQKQYITVYK